MNGTLRKNISVGSKVKIVQKNHQRNGELTTGVVNRLLTNSQQHPHGIKVKLNTGEIGRVKEIML